MVKIVFIVIAIFSAICNGQQLQTACEIGLDKVPVQTDFNIEDFLGDWYVPYYDKVLKVGSIDPNAFNPEKMRMNITKAADLKSYDVRSVAEISLPFLGKRCMEGLSKLSLSTNNPAKMTMKFSKPAKQDFEYWMVQTDYTTSALIFACGKRENVDKNSNKEKCKPGDSYYFLMSRNKLNSFTKKQETEFKKKLKQFYCDQTFWFQDRKFKNYCPFKTIS